MNTKNEHLDRVYTSIQDSHPLVKTEYIGALPETWDAAILGYAELYEFSSIPTIRIVYSYQAIKAIANDIAKIPSEVYSLMNSVLNGRVDDYSLIKPLILTKYNNKSLWKTIEENNLPRWDLLDEAVIGIASYADRDDRKHVVYNKSIIIPLLERTHATSDDTSNVADMFNVSILPMSLGDESPYYLTQVK